MASRADAEYFANKFNQLVGRHTGYIRAPKYASQASQGRSRYIGPLENTRARSGVGPSESSTQRRQREQANSKARYVDQYVKSLTQSDTQLDTISQRNSEIQKEFESLVKQDDNFQNSLIGRVLDVLSRPSYAVNEGLRASAEYQNEGKSEGFLGDLFSTDAWGATAAGIGRGLTGEAKTGFGDYIAEKREGDNAIGNALNSLDEEHPEISKWVDRGLGLTGDILFDPLNIVGGGSVGIARNTGKKVTTEGLQELAETAARNSVDLIDNVDDLGQLRQATTSRLTPEIAQEALEGGKIPRLSSVTRKGTPGSFPARQVLKDVAGDSARQATDRASLEIFGGPNARKLNVGRGTYAPTVANAVADSVRESVLRNFEEKFVRIRAAAGGGTPVGPTQMRTMLARDPKFRQFWDNLLVELNKTRNVNPYPTVEEALIGAAKTNSRDHIIRAMDEAATTVRSGVDESLQGVYDNVAKELTDFYYNAPSIRIGKHDVPMRFIGRAYQKASSKLGLDSNDLARQFSYGKQFPGRTANIAQKVRATGMENFRIEKEGVGRGVKATEAALTDIRTLFKGVSKSQREEIQRALEEGVPLLDPRLEEIRLAMQAKYAKLHETAVAAGAPVGQREADNFAYVYNKGGNKRARSEFKTNRKSAVESTGETVGYRTADAEKMGLKPVKDAAEAYLYYLMKHNRDMSKVWFLRDLIDHYGVIGTQVDTATRNARKLVKVADDRIPRDIKAAMNNPASEVYLPKPMADIYKNWEELASLSNDQLDSIRRTFNNITTKFKTMVTLPFPGFHVRNFLYDFFMGMVDGVDTRVYTEILQKYAHRGTARFKIAPGIELSWNELTHRFRQYAQSGGFYAADLPPSTSVRRFANIPGHLRHAAEMREDFGRLTHFLHALREEATGLSKRGGRNATDILEKATDQAVYRVNHYKFDYGALTAFERQNMKLLFPFYTFSRKALPMMMETLFLNPRLLARSYRMMTDPGEDSDSDVFNNMLIPAWLREIGYAQLTEEQEPWVVGGDVFPTAPFNTIDWPFNTGSDPNTKDFLQSVLQQTNPLINLPYEQVAGETILTGQDPGSLKDQLTQLFAGPFGAGAEAVNSDKSFIEQVLGNRLFTGLSTRKITEEQQGYAENELEDRVIDDPFRDFNYSQDTLRVYKNDYIDGRFVFRVKDNATGRVLYESSNPTEALEWAKAHT